MGDETVPKINQHFLVVRNLNSSLGMTVVLLTGGRVEENGRSALGATGETVVKVHCQIGLAETELDYRLLDGQVSGGRQADGQKRLISK